MLNLGVKINLELSEKEYPIYFERHNECVHCGAKKSLMLVDKFGNATTKEIHPFTHIKCNNCGRIFSIQWNRDNATGKMFPCAVDPSIKKEFLNLINMKKINNNGMMEI